MKKVYEHDFKKGKCTKCNISKENNAKSTNPSRHVCPVMGREEVAKFRDTEVF